MAIRDVKVEHATIQRWVFKFTPLLEKEFNKRNRLVNVGVWMKLISKSKGHGATTIGPSISTVLL